MTDKEIRRLVESAGEGADMVTDKFIRRMEQEANQEPKARKPVVDTIPTVPMVTKALNSLPKATLDKVFYYYERWQDEKEYEDFEDYKKELKALFADNETLWYVGATSRPFAIKFGVVDSKGNVLSPVVLKVTARGNRYNLSIISPNEPSTDGPPPRDDSRAISAVEGMVGKVFAKVATMPNRPCLWTVYANVASISATIGKIPPLAKFLVMIDSTKCYANGKTNVAYLQECKASALEAFFQGAK
jgi:hypothetical protein